MNLFLTVVLWMIGKKLTMGNWYYTMLILGLIWSLIKYNMNNTED